jgi:FkbM family methyltransferase
MLIWACQLVLRWDPVSGLFIRRASTKGFGKGVGCWRVPTAVLGDRMKVLSAGIGLDASFEVAMAEAGAEVVMVDPTPEVFAFAQQVVSDSAGLQFKPVGLWKTNGEQVFHAPENDQHISHSLTALQGERPAFTAECRTVGSLMEEKGWNYLDVLKIDIEGAEYGVLEDVLSCTVDIKSVCVEFDETHTPQDRGWRERISYLCHRLQAHGFRLVFVVPKGNYTFLRTD